MLSGQNSMKSHMGRYTKGSTIMDGTLNVRYLKSEERGIIMVVAELVFNKVSIMRRPF